MKTKLEAEFEFYLAHQNELVEKYNGKVVVIKDGKVLGAYDDEMDAIEETQKEHELGTFLIQLCTPGDSAYSRTFYSRAAFL
jgi:hypothetical protein